MSAVLNIQYKHQDNLASVTSITGVACPPVHSAPVCLQAYRFVQDPPSAECFLPQGLKNPRRVLDARTHSLKCSLLGLSMFTDEASARHKYLALKANMKNIGKALGTHLAVGRLDQNDGVATPTNESSHFDFFEFSTSTVSNKFTVIGQL